MGKIISFLDRQLHPFRKKRTTKITRIGQTEPADGFSTRDPFEDFFPDPPGSLDKFPKQPPSGGGGGGPADTGGVSTREEPTPSAETLSGSPEEREEQIAKFREDGSGPGSIGEETPVQRFSRFEKEGFKFGREDLIRLGDIQGSVKRRRGESLGAFEGRLISVGRAVAASIPQQSREFLTFQKDVTPFEFFVGGQGFSTPGASQDDLRIQLEELDTTPPQQDPFGFQPQSTFETPTFSASDFSQPGIDEQVLISGEVQKAEDPGFFDFPDVISQKVSRGEDVSLGTKGKAVAIGFAEPIVMLIPNLFSFGKGLVIDPKTTVAGIIPGFQSRGMEILAQLEGPTPEVGVAAVAGEIASLKFLNLGASQIGKKSRRFKAGEELQIKQADILETKGFISSDVKSGFKEGIELQRFFRKAPDPIFTKDVKSIIPGKTKAQRDIFGDVVFASETEIFGSQSLVLRGIKKTGADVDIFLRGKTTAETIKFTEDIGKQLKLTGADVKISKGKFGRGISVEGQAKAFDIKSEVSARGFLLKEKPSFTAEGVAVSKVSESFARSLSGLLELRKGGKDIGSAILGGRSLIKSSSLKAEQSFFGLKQLRQFRVAKAERALARFELTFPTIEKIIKRTKGVDIPRFPERFGFATEFPELPKILPAGKGGTFAPSKQPKIDFDFIKKEKKAFGKEPKIELDFNKKFSGSSEIKISKIKPSKFKPSIVVTSTFAPSVIKPTSIIEPSTFKPSPTPKPSIFKPSTFAPSLFKPSIFRPQKFFPPQKPIKFFEDILGPKPAKTSKKRVFTGRQQAGERIIGSLRSQRQFVRTPSFSAVTKFSLGFKVPKFSLGLERSGLVERKFLRRGRIPALGPVKIKKRKRRKKK